VSVRPAVEHTGCACDNDAQAEFYLHSASWGETGNSRTVVRAGIAALGLQAEACAASAAKRRARPALVPICRFSKDEAQP